MTGLPILEKRLEILSRVNSEENVSSIYVHCSTLVRSMYNRLLNSGRIYRTVRVVNVVVVYYATWKVVSYPYTSMSDIFTESSPKR